MDALPALALTGALAAVHLVAPSLGLTHLHPRSRILSAFGGVSVAYVVVNLLPDVAKAQSAVEASATGFVAELERHAYVAALVGLVAFYGLEHAAQTTSADDEHAEDSDEEDEDGPAAPAAFWASLGAFAVYNTVIGLLVADRARHDGITGAVLLAVALAVHLLVMDVSLRDHHEHRHDRVGRPVLAAAVLAGGVFGTLVEVSDAALGLALAFVGGAILLNVMKEELPAERDGRFLPFVGAAAVYTAILLVAG